MHDIRKLKIIIHTEKHDISENMIVFPIYSGNRFQLIKSSKIYKIMYFIPSHRYQILITRLRVLKHVIRYDN